MIFLQVLNNRTVINELHAMKKQLFIVGSLLFLPFFLIQAQIIEEIRPMSKGTQPALIINLPGTSEDVVENVWKDYVKKYGAKVRYERKDKEFISSGAHLSAVDESINDVSANLFAVSTVSERGIEFSLWIERGEGRFVNSTDASTYEEAERFLLEFALEVAQTEVQLDLEQHESELRRLESTLKKLQNDREHYDREIENARMRIARAEEDIQSNLKEQGAVRTMIDKQLDLIDQVKTRLKGLKR